MVKHTQTIRRQQVTNCLSVFDLFMRLTLTVLTRLMASYGSLGYVTALTANLVTFTEEILNVKLYFLCSVKCRRLTVQNSSMV